MEPAVYLRGLRVEGGGHPGWASTRTPFHTLWAMSGQSMDSAFLWTGDQRTKKKPLSTVLREHVKIR